MTQSDPVGVSDSVLGVSDSVLAERLCAVLVLF